MGHACMDVEVVQGCLQKSSGTQKFAVRSFVRSSLQSVSYYWILSSSVHVHVHAVLNIATL